MMDAEEAADNVVPDLDVNKGSAYWGVSPTAAANTAEMTAVADSVAPVHKTRSVVLTITVFQMAPVSLNA